MSRSSRLLVWLPRLAIAASSALLVAELPDLADGDWTRLRTSAAHQLWLPVLLLVLSVGLRGRTTLQVVGAVLGGFFTASFLAHRLGDLAADVMGDDDPWRLALAVPVIEEVAKLVPLLLLAFAWRKRYGSPGIVDFGLGGVAIGAGFAFHEDALWSRLSGSGTDEPLGWLLPQMYVGGSEVGVVVGHSVWTGLVGIAIGVAVNRRHPAATLLPVLALALVVFDHGSWNNVGLREDWRWILLDGWLPALLLIGGLVLAFVIDTRALRRIPSHRRITLRDVPGYVVNGNAAGPVRRLHHALLQVRVSALAANGMRQDVRPARPAVEPDVVPA